MPKNNNNEKRPAKLSYKLMCGRNNCKQSCSRIAVSFRLGHLRRTNRLAERHLRVWPNKNTQLCDKQNTWCNKKRLQTFDKHVSNLAITVLLFYSKTKKI